MRATVAIVIVVLSFGLGSTPVLGQTGDQWSYSIHMIDALAGWAEPHWAATHDPDITSILRTVDGGIHWKDVHSDPLGNRLLSLMLPCLPRSLLGWESSEGTLDTTRIFRTVDGGQTWKYGTTPGGSYRID